LRQESEESWRQRLDEAYNLYQIASARYRWLLEKAPESSSADSMILLALAHNAESKTLAEYKRVLKIVTDLTVHGVKQETQPRHGQRRKT
jgi:hypothetical protein